MADIVERRIGDLTVGILRETCISSGNCVKVAPGVFELDEETLCSFRGTPEETDRETVVEACRVCPVEALRVRNDSGEELAP